jgi:WD40 repeat protein
MLAINKINTDNIIENQYKLFPLEIWKHIEDCSETFVTIIYQQMRQNIFKINLVNVITNDYLEEIFIDDIDEDFPIKLSSDSKYIVYINYKYGINYYSIEKKKVIKIISLEFINIEYNYIFYDRNGLYLIISNENTYIYTLSNNLVTSKCLDINDASDFMFNKDYSFLLCASDINDLIHIYNMKTFELIFSYNCDYTSINIINNTLFVNDSTLSVIYIIDIITKHQLYRINHNLDKAIISLTSIDNILAALFSNNIIHIFDIKLNKLIKEIIISNNYIDSIQIEFLNKENLIVKLNDEELVSYKVFV